MVLVLCLPHDVSLNRLDCQCVVSDSEASFMGISSALFFMKLSPRKILDTENASDAFSGYSWFSNDMID